jgi:DnaJ-domain-containing protein 1
MVGQNQAQSETSKDVAFLMQQMELRQRLDQVVGDLDALDELFKDVRESIMEYLDAFSVAWSAANWQEARNVIVKLQFASKLSSEIEDRQARLLDV